MSVTNWIVIGVALLWFTVMWWFKKFPTDVFTDVAEAMNSRGGNIFILCFLSVSFFKTSISMFYWVMDKMADGKLTADNAMVLAGWSFVTGMAFGGAFGALLKTMTGGDKATEEKKPNEVPK